MRSVSESIVLAAVGIVALIFGAQIARADRNPGDPQRAPSAQLPALGGLNIVQDLNDEALANFPAPPAHGRVLHGPLTGVSPDASVEIIPEPGSALLCGGAILGTLLFRRRR